VGLEIEFGHVTLEETLALLQRTLGGTVRAESRTEGAVDDTRWGSFHVEFDSAPLKSQSYLKPLEHLGVEPDSPTAQFVENSVLRVAAEVVPVEIVSPPIPWPELSGLDPLWAALQDAGAEDTRASLLYAFGMQLNPEAAELSAAYALAHLQSFLLLEDWIEEETQVDLTRRLSPYVRGFPMEYQRLILAPGYAPDWGGFVRDYVAHNPTRNRALDVLPLIVHATGLDLSAEVEDWSLVKARPTFHYRLPNCELNRPGWSPAVEWNRWVEVEKLAASPSKLRELSQVYLAIADAGGSDAARKKSWIRYMKERIGFDQVTPTIESGPRAHDARR
jgi:hypothetical protein